MTAYPEIREDAILTEWYAGAHAEANFPSPDPTGGLDWESCHASIAFSEIGPNEADRQLHGQLVTYTLGFDGRVRALSAEIDPDDARRIAAALIAFAEAADEHEHEVDHNACDRDEHMARVAGGVEDCPLVACQWCGEDAS